MQKQFTPLFFFLFLTLQVFGQHGAPKVYTSDIDNFWKAYDSIRTTSDTAKQLQYIQSLYIDRGTEGLKAFMNARDYSASLWVQQINLYPKFWASVRPNTLAAKTKAKEIEQSLKRLKALYPELREARMYFTIGGLRSGGTTTDDMVLIGAEIATGDATTDVSEFEDKWLANVFREQKAGNIVPLNIHEYIHPQQKGEAKNLLAQAIAEGACDFVTELVMDKPLQTVYIQYGRLHEKELKEKFKEVMFTTFYHDWLYNGTLAKTVADLGYFMGYAVCKSYYLQAANKKQAIKNIIELNYADSIAIEKFLQQSNYYPKGVNKTALLKQFEEKRPFVVRLEPFANGDAMVDASVKELKIIFSKPMGKGYSFNYGERGKDYSPIAGVTGFSEDSLSFTLKLELKPAHEYEFLITEKSFRSIDDYPLKPVAVKFKTK